MEDNLENSKKDYQAAAKRLLESDPFFPVTKIPITKEFLKVKKRIIEILALKKLNAVQAFIFVFRWLQNGYNILNTCNKLR